MTTQIKPTDFFKALSDPTRLKLVLILQKKDSQCVCDFIELLDQPQPTISRHLKHLRRVGILTKKRKGTWMWYSLDKDMPKWCKQTISLIHDES